MALAVAPKRQGGKSLPVGETEDVTCHLYCPSTAFSSVSMERNGQNDSSVSKELLSSLPPYSL